LIKAGESASVARNKEAPMRVAVVASVSALTFLASGVAEAAVVRPR
jgi:hypothetical protein